MNWEKKVLVLLRRAITTQEPSVIALRMTAQQSQVWIVHTQITIF